MSNEQLDRLTPDEQARMNALIVSDVIEPEVLPPDEEQKLYFDMQLTIKVLGWTERKSKELQPVLARQLRYTQRTRCYTKWGFKNFEEFLKEVVIPNVASRGIIYDIMKIVDCAPSITPAEYVTMPKTNFRRLVGFTNDQAPNFREELEKAKTMTVREYTNYTAGRKLSAPGEVIPVPITIFATADIASIWKKVRESERTIEVCETKNEGIIFQRLMEEWCGTYGVDLA